MTPVVALESSEEPSVEDSEKKADSELLAPSPEEQTPSVPSPSAQSEPTETKQEAAS